MLNDNLSFYDESFPLLVRVQFSTSIHRLRVASWMNMKILQMLLISVDLKYTQFNNMLNSVALGKKNAKPLSTVDGLGCDL